MPEVLFNLDRSNYQQCQQLYRGEGAQEYYTGDFWVEDAAHIEARWERKVVDSISIIRQRSKSNLFFRRTMRHIRDDATDMAILWYVKHGSLEISNKRGSHTVKPHDFAIVCSGSPFYIECQKASNGRYEAMHITVPTHLLRQHIPHDLSMGVFMRVERSEITIAERIFGDIFAAEDMLAEDSAQQLATVALATIGNAVRADAGRHTTTGLRFAEIRRFVEVHLCDPRLSAEMVTHGCGISRRYLSSVLRANGTNLPELIWDRRLEMAKQRLLSTRRGDVSISEIAFQLGFKSTAHFSRKFKRMFRVNPRDLRGSGVPQ
jgi:AraC-like DNA-binding protein